MAHDWPTVSTPILFGDGRSWTGTFHSYDRDAQRCTYRVQLFEGDQPAGELLVTTSTKTQGNEPALGDELVKRLSSDAYYTFVLDGIAYRYRVEEDDRNWSLSFSHRGVVYEDTAVITGDDGSTIKFEIPFYDVGKRGWWRDRRSMSRAIAERAVRIARRTGKTELGAAEIDEALYGPPRTLVEELAAATTALGLEDDDVREQFVQCWLAIGCTNPQDAESRIAIADWIASHADRLVASRDTLQKLLEKPGGELHVFSNRSALQFLIEACARVDVQLGLDAKKVDEALRGKNQYQLPWGIPASHVWWSAGNPVRRYDPYDD